MSFELLRFLFWKQINNTASFPFSFEINEIDIWLCTSLMKYFHDKNISLYVCETSPWLIVDLACGSNRIAAIKWLQFYLYRKWNFLSLFNFVWIFSWLWKCIRFIWPETNVFGNKKSGMNIRRMKERKRTHYF